MKLVALNSITDGKTTYKAGDVFEVCENFPESLAKNGSAKYLEPEVVVEEEAEEEVLELPEDLTELTVPELKDVCKKLGLSGYSSKKEAELVSMIEEAL